MTETPTIRGDALAKDLTWDEACRVVLGAADGALHYSEIASRIAAQGLRKIGANPAASVAAILSKSLGDEGSPFQRIGQGEYALKVNLQRIAEPSPQTLEPEVEQLETGALRAFGMFWQRDLVVWGGKQKLLGRQGVGASEVNFWDQVGVYLLHDRDRIIYVGRATDNMFTRLRAHTTDRLGGRWDRFSWFGLRSVQEDGSLSEPAVAWTHMVVIETLEALLIESLEPPLNRKRGDNFSAAEYLQVTDPEIETIRKKQLMGELLKAAGMNV